MLLKIHTFGIYRLNSYLLFLIQLCVYFEIMCILFCYLQDNNVHIGYDLILLSNRDEGFQRPSIPAHVWKDTKYVLGGSIFLFNQNNKVFFFRKMSQYLMTFFFCLSQRTRSNTIT